MVLVLVLVRVMIMRLVVLSMDHQRELWQLCPSCIFIQALH